MKKNTYTLNTVLAFVLGAVMLAFVLVRTFAPRVILFELDIPNLVLISLAALLVDHYMAPNADRCYICIPVFSAMTFGLLPWAAAFVNGDLLAGQGVDAVQTFDTQAGLFLHQLGALEFGFLGEFLAVGKDGVHVGDLLSILVDHGMLGSHDHEGYAEEGVGAGGVDFQALVGAGELEVDERAGGLADPVDLLLLDVLGILNGFQTLQQLIGVFGDAQIPDVLGLLDDIGVADVALTALAVLV